MYCLPDVHKALPAEKGKYASEVRLILDLFLIISQHTFSSKQLKHFLSLFQLPVAPMVCILRCWHPQLSRFVSSCN